MGKSREIGEGGDKEVFVIKSLHEDPKFYFLF